MNGFVECVRAALLDLHCCSAVIVGAPGCGKSSAALAAVRSCGLAFAVVDCAALAALASPERADALLLSSLLPLAAPSAHARGVVLLDGLETLSAASVCSHVVAERVMQLRGVAFVLATSSSVSSQLIMDFDRTFVVPALDEDERVALLRVLLQRDEGVLELARQFQGLSAGRIRQIVLTARIESDSFTDEDLIRIQAEQQPSALADLESAAHRMTFANVAGLESQKKLLSAAVLTPLHDPSKCEKFQVVLPRGIVMYGPHGSGKTLLATALAGECKLPVVVVSGPSIVSSVVGESEKRLANVFERARQSAPCLVLLDQADGLVPFSQDRTETQSRVVSCLASELDACARSGARVLVVATVERLVLLDEAILRRLELRVALPGPSLAMSRDLLRLGLARCSSRVSEAELEHASVLCQNCPAATVAAIINEAAMACVRAAVRKEVEGNSVVTFEQLQRAIALFAK